MSSVQEALKAREARKKKEQENIKAKTDKINSAVNSYKERKKESAKTSTSDLAKRINAEIEAIKKVSTPAYGSDSLKNTLNSTRENRVNVSNLIKEVESYKNYFDAETYKSFSSDLKSIKDTYDSYLSLADSRSNFETEEAYNKWNERYTKKAKEEQDVLGSADYKEYSQKGASIENPTMKEAEGFANIFGWRPGSEDIKNIVTYSRENANKLRMGAVNNSKLLGDFRYSHMTDNEVGIYNYYLAKYGEDKANEYLKSIDDELDQREAGKMAEVFDDNVFLESIMGFSAGVETSVQGLKGLADYVTGNTSGTDYSANQYADQIVASNNEGILKGIHDVPSVIGGMTPSILASTITGNPLVGATVMGGSAMGNAYNEMIDLGYDKWQARGYGFLVGASETALQYALGGISKLGGKLTGNAIGKVVATLDNALARTAIQLGGNMASEGLEEAIQTILEPAFKSLMTGEKFDAPKWEDIWYSALLGALSAGLLEGVPTIAGTAASSIEAKNIYGADPKALTTEALEIDPTNAHAQRMQAKLDGGKDISGYQLNRLVEANEQTLLAQDTAKMKSAVEARLTEVGETGDIGKLADVIVKAQSGEKLTTSERKLLTESKYGRRVSTELNPQSIESGEYTSAWAENIGTERINTEAYNKSLYDLAAEKAGIAVGEEKTPVSVNAFEKEIATGSKFEASEDGKTRIGDTEISVKEIASVKNGEVMLRLEDGSTVNASDVEFGSDEERLLYENVVHMGLNAATANAFINGYDGTIPVAEYALGFRQAYRYGELGIPKGEMASEGFSLNLTDSQKSLAYELGMTDAKYKASEKAKITSIGTIKSENIASKDTKKGKLHNTLKPTNELQRTSLKTLGVIAEALSIDIYTFESPLVNGKRTGANGWYDPKDNSLHLDLYAGNDGRGTMLFTASHELTHHIREKIPAKFKAFADFLFEQYGEKGISVSELIAKKKAFLEDNGRITPDMTDAQAYGLAYEEVVADACESFLADGGAVAKIAELKAKDKTLWETIKDFLTKLVARIKAAYEGLSPDSVEGRLIAEMLDNAEKLKAMWTEMLVEASEVTDLVEVDMDTESVAPMFSERTWTESEYVTEREKTAKAISKTLNVDIKTAYKYIDDINGVARLIADDRARLDYEPNLDDKATVLKPNSEYKYSVDMSTLCAKRLLFTGTFDAIQRALPNTVFDSEDIVSLREMMQKRGYEVACGICYVESTRREIGRITQDFIDSYKEAQKTGKPITRINSEGKVVDLKKTKDQKETTADKSTDKFFAEKDYTPTLADLNTTDIDLVKRDHPLVYEAYLNFMNARGQAKPKLLETRAEYKGEILKHFKAKTAVKARNNAGGLRLQSFSDFEVPHMIDMMQIVMDMSRVGLKSQAYTKVPAFAEIFGDSGVKINLYLIAKGDGLDANGNLVFDDVEGINHKEAFKLRDKYTKNVGTILVGKTDAHIIAAMADPRIDYIIPFHKSSWKESLYDALGLTGYADYTDTQNEKPIDKSRKISNFDPSEYWDFTKSGDENAQIYLAKCREDGRIPKFPQFQGYPGYWKLLIDFKMYDNNGVGSPQEVVKPIFNTEASERILREYEGGHKSFPVAKDVVEDFVKEHKEVKYSDRDTLGNELSNEQALFFKDSKVRDKKGNLMVLYHGTTANFNTFKKGDVGFHFGTKGAARGRVGFGKNVTLKEVYLNITNPIVFDEDLGSWDADYRLTRELFDRGVLTQEEAESILLSDDKSYRRTTEAANKKLASLLIAKGYDGIAYSNTFETKKATTSYIIFNSNQAKEITNKTPTSNADIRYSFRNSKSGMANDALIPYNEAQTRFINQRGDYIIDSFEKLKEVVNLAFDHPDMKAIAHFGMVDVATLQKIKNSIPNLPESMDTLFADRRSYSIATTLDGIRHIVKEKNLTRQDVIDYLDRFADTIVEYDEVDFHYYTRRGRQMPGLLFRKDFPDGKYFSFDLVSQEKRSLLLQSLYIDSVDYEKRKSADPVLMQNAPASTPKARGGQTSTNSISQTPNSVKRKFSDRNFPNNAEDIAKEYFGTTNKWSETGWLLKDGTQLDFSGRHWQKYPEFEIDLGESFYRGKRNVEHYEIVEAFPELRDFSSMAHRGGNLDGFLNRGNIRIVGKGCIDLAAMPTEEQFEKLRSYFRENIDQYIVIGIGLGDLNFREGTSASTIIEGIRDYFSNNRVQQSDLMRFHTMYSDRPTDSVSNRTLLANALESVAQNDIERSKLTQYKEKISLIELEQAKLSELRAEIKELSFAKGRKDTARIKELQFEANQTANRINTYDRQLLNLESTTALKGVLEREKQKAYKKAQKEGKEALEAYREKMTKTQKELLTRYKDQRKEQRERATERRDKTSLRRRIRKIVKELNSLFKNGTKKRNIKQEMKDTVATSLALAEVLFNDDIKNEDIVRLGVASVTTKESEYLDKYRDLLDLRDSLRADIESIYANGNVRETMLADVAKVQEKIKKVDGQIAYLNNKLSDLFERERARLNKATVDAIIDDLVSEYSKLKDSENGYIKNAYNEAMEMRLVALKESLKGTVAKDMDVYQLQELYDTFKAVMHMIRHSNSLFRDGRTEDLMTYVSNVQGEIYEASTDQKDRNVIADKIARTLNEFSWNNLRPVDAVERLGSQTFEKLFWDFVHAMGVAARDITEAGEVIASAREKFGYSKWNMELAETTYTTRDGLTFKPSLADKLSIYAYSQREQAEDHMTEGGFTYDTGRTYKETENGKTYVRRKLSNTYRLSKEDIQTIISSLTDEQRGYVDAILPYLTDMGKKGNEVSMTLYGIELFGEKVYFPLQSSRDYLSSTTQTLGATPTMASLANSGFTKQTTPHASNPIVLRSFDDVVLEHIEKMSNYHALVIPIENLRRVFDNVGRETEGMPIATKALIGSRFGEEAQKYFEQWLTDINGGISPSGAKSILGKLFSRAKGTSVAANLSVVAQQYFAIIRAMEVVDTKYFIPFINSDAKKTDTKQYEELLKYAPIAIIKEMGGFDVGSRGRVKDYIGYEGARKDAKYLKKKADDLWMWGAGKMDELGWVTIWKAVKSEVASEQKLTPGTDEFYEACRVRFTEVVTKTQVFDSVASRSGYMRSQHDAVKYATSFMGEPTAIVGRIFGAGTNLVRAYKSGNKARIKSAWGRLGRVATVIVVSNVLGKLAQSLVYGGRDDDEDEALLERWMRNFAEALADDLKWYTPLNYLPFGRDIVSTIEGWDVERPDMTLIADVIKSVKKVTDGDLTLDDSLKLIGSVGNFFGLPLKNIIREIKSAINVVGDVLDDIQPTDVGGAFVEGFTGDERSKTEMLYDSIMRGDTERVEVIKATYKTETAYTTALRKALRENDPRIKEAAQADVDGNVSECNRIVTEILDEGNFSEENIKAAIKSEIDKLTENEDVTPSTPKKQSIYEEKHYYQAVSDGNTSLANEIKEDIINTHVANGKDREEAEESFESSFRSYVGKMYKDGEASRSTVSNMLTQYGGYDANETYWKLKEWDFDIENGEDAEYSKYTDFYDAVKTGSNLKAIIKEYTDHGVKKETLASQITSHYKPLYIEMSRPERASIKGYLLNAYALLGYDRTKKSKDIDKWLED